MELFNKKMIEGYDFLESGDVVKACDCWLDLWEKVKEISEEKGIKDIEDLDDIIETVENFPTWAQDLEMEFENAALVDRSYFNERISYCEEFIEIFTDGDPFIDMSMKTAVAESYFEIGEEKKSFEKFEEVIREYKGTVWPYIKWGDTQWLSSIKKDGITQDDLKRALDIYNRGKDVIDLEDYQLLEDRIEEVKSFINKY